MDLRLRAPSCPMAPPPSPRAPPPSLGASPPPLRAPPHLPDEIVENIFLRVPPEDNARLLRAAIACKRWARIFGDRGFRRRYRERHRNAPMLGLLANLADTGGVARFLPACGFRPPRADRQGYRAHDARHGRVLLNRVPGTPAPQGQEESVLAVWDPTTGEHHQVPPLLRCGQVSNWNAAVLCGAPGPCDHLDCQGGPFSVFFMGVDGREVFAHVYSSASGAWSAGTCAQLPVPDDDLDAALPGVLARDAFHFVLLQGTMILRCDLANGQMAVLRLPHRPPYDPRIVLTTTEDGGLGFAEVSPLTGLLRLWAWSVQAGASQDAGQWVPRRAFDLIEKLPADALSIRGPPNMVAYADGVGVIFLKAADNTGLYSIDVKTGKVTKVTLTGAFGFYDLVPYVSFYIPVIRAALATSGEGSGVGASASA